MLVLTACALLVLAFYMYKLYMLVLEIEENQEIVLEDELPKSDQATKIYANDYDPATGKGTLLGKIFVKNRKYVKLEEIPLKLQLCMLRCADEIQNRC